MADSQVRMLSSAVIVAGGVIGLACGSSEGQPFGFIVCAAGGLSWIYEMAKSHEKNGLLAKRQDPDQGASPKP